MRSMKLMTRHITLTFLWLLLWPVGLMAQQLKASAPSQVQVGQRFQISWQLNASGSDFVAPEITDFQVLGGPNQSTSVQLINGSMSQSITLSYVLRAVKEGAFNIGPARMQVDGKEVQSNELTINVIPGNSNANAGGNAAAQQQQQRQQQAASGSGGENELFARIEVSDREVYQGEGLRATLKLYSRVRVINAEDWDLPEYEGFWSKDVNQGKQMQMQNEVVDGVMYQTGTIQQMILYPQKSGELEIDAFEITVIAREAASRRGRSLFDQFFGGYQDVRKPVRSNSVEIKVKPLPSPRPSNFSGLTGNFRLKTELDRNQTTANEAVNLKVTVTGDGNLNQLQPLDIEFPPDVEVFDPKVSDNISYTANGISGSRTFEYVMIPRYAGEFTIGPFELSYFDPKAGSYRSSSREALDLIVERGEEDATAGTTMRPTRKEDIQLIGSDVRFIKQGQYPILSEQRMFYRSNLFYALLAVPALLFVLLLGYVEYQRSQGKDMVRLRSKKASGLATKRLKQAHKLRKENRNTEFFEEVFKALNDHAADKFAIPVAELTKDRLREMLQEKGVPQDVSDQYIDVLNKAEFARFAPGAETMETIYEDALKAITNVERHA